MIVILQEIHTTEQVIRSPRYKLSTKNQLPFLLSLAIVFHVVSRANGNERKKAAKSFNFVR